MARRAVVLGGVALASISLYATTKGPDAGGYSATDTAVYSYVDVAGSNGGVSVLQGVDDGVTALTLPFAFPFYGTQYTTACVSTNGALYLVPSASACTGLEDFAPLDLSAVAPQGDLAGIFPLWSDLTFQVPGSGAIYYKAVGTAPTRRFVIQWKSAFPQNSTNGFDFEAVLFEGSGKVLFQYQRVDFGSGNPASKGAEATIGIRAPGGLASSKQIVWSVGAPVVSDASLVQFTTTAIRITGDVDGDGSVTCSDMQVVKASFGKSATQQGFDPRADVNGDRLVNVLDLSIVSRGLPAGSKCP
ncbi:MAG: dockerin type I domain-containing protein [Vicinamibacterales bacterium]